MIGVAVAFVLVVPGILFAPFIVDRLLFDSNKSGFEVQRVHRHKRQAFVCSIDRRSLVSQQVLGWWGVVLFTLIGLFGVVTNNVLGILFLPGAVVTAVLCLRVLLKHWDATLVLDSDGIRWRARFGSWVVPGAAIYTQGTSLGGVIVNSLDRAPYQEIEFKASHNIIRTKILMRLSGKAGLQG